MMSSTGAERQRRKNPCHTGRRSLCTAIFIIEVTEHHVSKCADITACVLVRECVLWHSLNASLMTALWGVKFKTFIRWGTNTGATLDAGRGNDYIWVLLGDGRTPIGQVFYNS